MELHDKLFKNFTRDIKFLAVHSPLIFNPRIEDIPNSNVDEKYKTSNFR